ncbi:phage tail protein [Candidatus Pacearchaeota archaeon]|jgi:hypothetical protein|nr:phage tail protein [Candidatus Pacearchaeota archaeon]
MGFWSDGIQSEPKRAYRWRLMILGVPVYTLKKVTKPSFSLTESKHAYLNHTFFFPGRVEWEEMSFSTVDPIDPDGAKNFVDMISAAGYNPPSTENDLETLSKNKSILALGNVVIEQLDDMGNVNEKWTLKNAWVKSVKFGELDYESDDLLTYEVTLRFDWAWISVLGNAINSGDTWNPGSAN